MFTQYKRESLSRQNKAAKTIKNETATPSEISLTVPAELVKTTVGLAIDFGGSVFKVIYRSRDNKKEIELSDGGPGHLQLISFPRDDWEKGLEYLKENAEITRAGSDHPTIFTTGVGCTNHGKAISDALSVRLKQVTEFDCFVKSFHYLASKLSRSDFLEPFQTEAVKDVITTMNEQIRFVKEMQALSKADFGDNNETLDLQSLTGQAIVEPTRAPLAESENMFPCLLAMCGSGFGFFQVNKDKTFKILDGSNRGGRSFYGIGRLLTDCETFDEIIELASRGNHRNIDVYTNDLIPASLAEDGDGSVYSKTAEVENAVLIYSFGKCAGDENKENFKREDIARAWLQYYIIDIVQTIHLLCLATKMKRLFFCGSFCNTDLVRQIITTELARRNLGVAIFGADSTGPVGFDFIKAGAHLGAIGAMINELEE